MPTRRRPKPTRSAAQSDPEYRARRERIPLPYGRKGEQQSLDLWHTLCSDPDFQADIKAARQRLSADYWRRLHELRDAANRVNAKLDESCQAILDRRDDLVLADRPRVSVRHEHEIRHLTKKWALDDLEGVDGWLQNLLFCWDPNCGELPGWTTVVCDLEKLNAHSPDAYRSVPAFVAVTASVAYAAEATGKDGQPRALRATIVFRPGVTRRQAQDVAAVAVKRLGREPRRHRPGLTAVDRGLVRILFEFERERLEKPRFRSQVVRRVTDKLKEMGRRASHTWVGNELRQWLRDNGYHVRQYTTGRRDSR